MLAEVWRLTVGEEITLLIWAKKSIGLYVYNNVDGRKQKKYGLQKSFQSSRYTTNLIGVHNNKLLITYFYLCMRLEFIIVCYVL